MSKKRKTTIVLFIVWLIVMTLFVLPIGGYESGLNALFGKETPNYIKVLATVAGFGCLIALLVAIIRQWKKAND